MRWVLVSVFAITCVAACAAIFKPKREKPPDTWSIKAAALHSMMSVPPEFLNGDCTAAPQLDLQWFCQKKCGEIGELNLKAYCAWDCDAISNPDLAVMCKLETKKSKDRTPSACDAIDDGKLQALCKQWLAPK
jgi:hypothetical protein